MKKPFIAGLILGAAAQVALAQEAKSEPKSPKIAIIDMARVSSESLMGKGYASQLESLQNEINAEGTKKFGAIAHIGHHTGNATRQSFSDRIWRPFTIRGRT